MIQQETENVILSSVSVKDLHDEEKVCQEWSKDRTLGDVVSSQRKVWKEMLGKKVQEQQRVTCSAEEGKCIKEKWAKCLRKLKSMCIIINIYLTWWFLSEFQKNKHLSCVSELIFYLDAYVE